MQIVMEALRTKVAPFGRKARSPLFLRCCADSQAKSAQILRSTLSMLTSPP
jgi:hypothetical protein